ALEKELPKGSGPKELYDAAEHLIRAGGKKYRPAMTLLACESVGGNANDAVPTAIAIELLHTASLIHDDIVDGDSLRRGVRTVHSIWGKDIATVAGDLLIGKAVEVMASGTPPKVIAMIAQASAEMCEGETLDIKYHGNLETVTEEQYLEMVRKKSASLVKVAVEAGAVIGGGLKEAVSALSRYGEMIGIAFQLRDDILNLTSTKKKLGKPVKTDILTRRPNLVLIRALHTPATNEMTHKFIRSEGVGYDLGQFVMKLDELDVVEYVQEMSENFSKEAELALRKVTLKGDMKKALMSAADFASKRIY
ncbi:MAG TPA: polyprenyl synthetase family protein, partial [archaeon]|nr:polyprenyl synthetase family protein [archaeon]